MVSRVLFGVEQGDDRKTRGRGLKKISLAANFPCGFD